MELYTHDWSCVDGTEKLTVSGKIVGAVALAAARPENEWKSEHQPRQPSN